MKRLLGWLPSPFVRRSPDNLTPGEVRMKAANAERVTDPSYKGWAFFDTCCLSDLVNLADAGEEERVRAFVRGRAVVIPKTILMELRSAPVIAHRVTDVLSSANLYLIQSPTNDWEWLQTTELTTHVELREAILAL